MKNISCAVKITHMIWYTVFIYSVTHFVVDFACAFLMFRSIAKTSDWYLCVLLYNFCAFAMQMPLGIIADVLNRNRLIAALGCSFVIAAFGIVDVPVAAVIIAGLGNALFHLGGGIDILNISDEKSGALGVFVSPGAWGVYFGTLLGKGDYSLALPIIATLFVTGILIFHIHKKSSETFKNNAEFSLFGGASRQVLLAAICFFLVVSLRSYVGLTMNFSWKIAGYWGFAIVCAVVLGKTVGGFAADKFGMGNTALLTLGMSAPLFFFSGTPLSGILAVLLFNMTMPITLCAMARIFPGAKGFSFGLLTFSLFLGFLPVYFGVNPPPNANLTLTLSAVISLALLLFGLRKANLWTRR